jgi:hypothetical protein
MPLSDLAILVADVAKSAGCPNDLTSQIHTKLVEVDPAAAPQGE